MKTKGAVARPLSSGSLSAVGGQRSKNGKERKREMSESIISAEDLFNDARGPYWALASYIGDLREGIYVVAADARILQKYGHEDEANQLLREKLQHAAAHARSLGALLSDELIDRVMAEPRW